MPRRYWTSILSLFKYVVVRLTATSTMFAGVSRHLIYWAAGTCCIFLWFSNGVNEFSKLKLIEKHQVEIEVLVLCSLWVCVCSRTESRISVRMIFAFDCADCSSIKQILCERLCGGPSETYFFFLSFSVVRCMALNIHRYYVCVVVPERWFTFFFNHQFQRITLALSLRVVFSNCREHCRWCAVAARFRHMTHIDKQR